MSYDFSASFRVEQAKEEGSFLVDMYVVNASYSGWDPMYYANINQDIYGFQMNASGNLVATEQLYTGLPIERNSLSNNTDSEVPEVSISIPNVDRTIEGVIQNYNYLRGRDIYILSGHTKFLPAGSSANHIGEVDDNNNFLVEKFFVDSTTSSSESVTFSCKPKFILRSAVFPSRKYSRECAWALMGKYGGTECDPNASINTASFPTCDGTLKECEERHNKHRYGGFPSVPRRGIIIV